MRNIQFTDIFTSDNGNDPLVYCVCFKRGKRNPHVEITPRGKVSDRFDCTDDEVEQAKKVLRAYQTLKAHGLFNRHCEYVPSLRFR